MSRLKNILKSPLFYIILVAISIAIIVVVHNELKFWEVLTLISAFIIAFIEILSSQKKKEIREIRKFELLHNAMTEEMKNILDDDSSTKKHLYILSFTPAFGNISAPKLYENTKDDKKTYKYLLENIVTKKKEVDVKIICYDKNKRFEYHKNWAEILAKDNENEQARKIKTWEEQAIKIIELVREKCGFSSVMEVDHMHPILFFSSDNILIQYSIRMNPESKSSEVSGTMLHNESKINFFYQAFKEYKEYYRPGKVVELYESYFKKEDKYIKAADYVKRVLDGKAAEKELDISKINILLAYGGGKDSTMVLTFLKYVQELFLKDSKRPFKLHILVHIHPGMRENVFQNIHNVFKKLELDKDSNVKITFQTKDLLFEKTDIEQFINSDFDASKISMPDNIKKAFRREVLLLGHLSKGLGRQTFCYTCNIDMIMSIINYTSHAQEKIDFIVTGDSKDEQRDYTKWLNSIFSFISKNPVDIGDGNYDTKFFFRDFTKLQNTFSRDYLGIGSQKPDKSKRIINYPELFDIHKYIKFSILTNFKELLEKELDFSFHENSFNFSETDCFYPAIMAHLAGLRGDNYTAHLKLHIDHVAEIMKQKGFSPDLIKKGRDSFDNNKIDKIKKFLLTQFDIDDSKLTALVYSPFLDDGKRLDSFLKEHSIDLKSSSVINYIKKGNISNGDEKSNIDAFIEKWIGLSHKDIKRIMDYSEKSNPPELLEIIAKKDPYINENVITEDNKIITISGR